MTFANAICWTKFSISRIVFFKAQKINFQKRNVKIILTISVEMSQTSMRKIIELCFKIINSLLSFKLKIDIKNKQSRAIFRTVFRCPNSPQVCMPVFVCLTITHSRKPDMNSAFAGSCGRAIRPC